MRFFRLSSVVILILCGATAVAAQGVALLSHRAVYDLSLARANAGSGVLAVRGRLVMEWADACDGYILSQRMRSETDEDSKATVSDFNLSTWESKDGRHFRFASRHTTGPDVEEVRGQAAMGPADVGGTVEFVKPAGETMVLPGGTLFPTAHSVLLLRRAVDGANYVRTMVFDGSSLDSLQDSTAWIGKRMESGTYQGIGAADLAPHASWRVRIAYFPLDQTDALPQYEVAYRMFENGVAIDVVLDYGDFALKGALTQLERVKSGC